MCECVRVCVKEKGVCVCVCVCAYVKEREVCVCVCVYLCVHACVHARERWLNSPCTENVLPTPQEPMLQIGTHEKKHVFLWD